MENYECRDETVIGISIMTREYPDCRAVLLSHRSRIYRPRVHVPGLIIVETLIIVYSTIVKHNGHQASGIHGQNSPGNHRLARFPRDDEVSAMQRGAVFFDLEIISGSKFARILHFRGTIGQSLQSSLKK